MHSNARAEIWRETDAQTWDIIIIGGGITGAGILREAARRGIRALLVEMRDYAWGTSSRSSKMVHGGLRYLATGQIGLTLESVRERQQLLRDGEGLIDPMGFLIATHKDDKPGRMTFGAGLAVYDLMALQWSHRYYTPAEFRMLAPHIRTADLEGGFRYNDAQTDDARLVLRVLQEAMADGGAALNYVKAEAPLRDDDGRVNGVVLHDAVSDTRKEARARVVINATGAWSDALREQIGAEKKMRPLRGSHLVFPSWRLPVAQAISFLHPVDRRPVFAFPWEGVALLGTTDIDHDAPLNEEPAISAAEVAYLMAAAAHQFPALKLTLDDVVATWAGVRPVVGSGKDDPSKESRDYVLWGEDGLLTVTGGKLTTFRAVALSALKAIARDLPDDYNFNADTPVLNPVETPPQGVHNEKVRRRLVGRYGERAADVVAAAGADEMSAIPGTLTLWAELRWAARAEQVVHLEDLLLRRTRLGLLLPEGGLRHIERIRAICQPEIGWDDVRWEREVAAYRDLWHSAYSLPPRETITDWREIGSPVRTTPQNTPDDSTRRRLPLFVALLTIALAVWGWRRRSRRT